MKTFSEWLVSEVDVAGVTAPNPTTGSAQTTDASLKQTAEMKKRADELKKKEEEIKKTQQKLRVAQAADLKTNNPINPHQNVKNIIKSNPEAVVDILANIGTIK